MRQARGRPSPGLCAFSLPTPNSSLFSQHPGRRRANNNGTTAAGAVPAASRSGFTSVGSRGMSTAAVRGVVRRLGLDDPPTDAALLTRYARHRDPSAFAELLRRHGPVVLGVCRRTLSDPHAAEDAFQAVFLVLARKAGTVRPP